MRFVLMRRDHSSQPADMTSAHLSCPARVIELEELSYQRALGHWQRPIADAGFTTTTRFGSLVGIQSAWI